MRHVILCPHCHDSFEFPISPADDECPGCGRTVKNLGLLPQPDWKVEMGSVVTKPGVAPQVKKDIDCIPKWVCPMCGANCGRLQQGNCKRCGCEIARTGLISLHDRVPEHDPFAIGDFHRQAMQPLKASTALYLLGRASFEETQSTEVKSRQETALHDNETETKRDRWSWGRLAMYLVFIVLLTIAIEFVLYWELSKLENGQVESVEVFFLVAWMCNLIGMVGALLVWPLIGFAVAVAIFIEAYSKMEGDGLFDR